MKRERSLLTELVEDWPQCFSVEIGPDAFQDFTVTLWWWDQTTIPWQRMEITHVHMDDFEDALKALLYAKNKEFGERTE